MIRQRPVMATALFGLACAMAYIPASLVLGRLLHWTTALNFMIWLALAAYSWMLTRISGKSPLAATFPLAFLLAANLLPFVSIPTPAYGFFALGTLSWIRSSICCPGPTLPRLALEMTLCLGSTILAAWFGPRNAFEAALLVWLVFLLQASYFLFINQAAPEPRLDRFEQARRRAERLLAASE